MKHLVAAFFILLLSDSTSAQLHLVTYNIRYNNAGDGENAWINRREAMADSLQHTGADIICLQEVLHDQLMFLQGALKEYRYYGVGRDDGKTAGEYAPLFYRTDRFTVVDSGTLWLSETPGVPSKGWDAALNRIATWLKLKSKASGKEIVVFNTHFDHQGKQARLESARLLTLQALQKAKDMACILAGDFNFVSSDEPYDIIDFAGYSDTWKEMHVPDAYTFTGFKTDLSIAKRIDFVFVNKYLHTKQHRVLYWKSRNDSYLSDHLAVEVKLNF